MFLFFLFSLRHYNVASYKTSLGTFTMYHMHKSWLHQRFFYFSLLPMLQLEVSNVAAGIKSSIKYSRNKFFDFLPQININSFFINPTDKTEIKNILSLNPLRSIGPNSIPTKILKLLSNDISTQFAELFNLSFSINN